MKTGLLVLCALALVFTTSCAAIIAAPAVMALSTMNGDNGDNNVANTGKLQHISGLAYRASTNAPTALASHPKIHMSGYAIPLHLSGNSIRIKRTSHQ